jgi:hypothetical protein
MEELYQSIMSNPWLAIAIPGIIFVIAVILLFRRILSFIFTLILFIIAVVSGFALLNNKDVQEFIGKDPAQKGKTLYERLLNSWECVKGHFWETTEENQE